MLCVSCGNFKMRPQAASVLTHPNATSHGVNLKNFVASGKAGHDSVFCALNAFLAYKI